MGDRGPVGKRTEERRRRNTSDSEGRPNEVEKVQADGPAPEAPDVTLHEWCDLAQQLWDAAVDTPMSTYYEATDWAMLTLLCESIHRSLSDQPIKVKDADGGESIEYVPMPIKGSDLSAMLKLGSSLMLTEGDRRRLNLEIKRATHGQVAAPATAEQVVQNRQAMFAVKGGKE